MYEALVLSAHKRRCLSYGSSSLALTTFKRESAPSEKSTDGVIQHESLSYSSLQNNRRLIPPFILAHDVPRGVMYALQALLSYTLMLAGMCVLPPPW